MELSTILAFLGIPSAVTGLCFWLVERRITVKEREREKQDEIRKQSELILIRGMSASIALGEATANAIKNGTCNGEMSAALDYAQKVKHEQKDFLYQQGVEQIY